MMIGLCVGSITRVFMNRVIYRPDIWYDLGQCRVYDDGTQASRSQKGLYIAWMSGIRLSIFDTVIYLIWSWDRESIEYFGSTVHRLSMDLDSRVVRVGDHVRCTHVLQAMVIYASCDILGV